jgi:NAD(P) transhydrogenase subunit alpha
MAVKIFVPNESDRGETRVALVPPVIKRLGLAGTEVLVESHAGVAASHSDESYQSAGAKIISSDGWADADIVLVVGPPSTAQVGRMRSGALLVGLLSPYRAGELISAAAEKGLAAMALEYLPRITRAQAMDVLSSQANIAGYKAVLLAADHAPRIFPMLMTAAGTLQPTKVLVIGAGVAGLQAIATARRLGAIVSAYDVRPAVKEQIQSLGAKFVELPLETTAAQDAGGYAKELTPEQQQKQRDLLARAVIESDAVITTAAIPGKPAPRLIPAEVVDKMPPGAVIVDLAADTGGNCEATEPGKTIRRNGVTIIGAVNVAASVPFHASQVYANNLASLLKLIVKPPGEITIDVSDEIIAGILLCKDGQIVHPRLKEVLAHA